jgi:hypothetical protein
VFFAAAAESMAAADLEACGNVPFIHFQDVLANPLAAVAKTAKTAIVLAVAKTAKTAIVLAVTAHKQVSSDGYFVDLEACGNLS